MAGTGDPGPDATRAVVWFHGLGDARVGYWGRRFGSMSAELPPFHEPRAQLGRAPTRAAAMKKKKAKRKKKKTKEAVLPHERVWRPDNKEIHGDEIRRAGTPSGAGLSNVGLGNAGGVGVAGDL